MLLVLGPSHRSSGEDPKAGSGDGRGPRGYDFTKNATVHHGRQRVLFPLQGREGDRRRTCRESFTLGFTPAPVAPPVSDSRCGFQLLMESLQVVFVSSILQGSSY